MERELRARWRQLVHAESDYWLASHHRPLYILYLELTGPEAAGSIMALTQSQLDCHQSVIHLWINLAPVLLPLSYFASPEKLTLTSHNTFYLLIDNCTHQNTSSHFDTMRAQINESDRESINQLIITVKDESKLLSILSTCILMSVWFMFFHPRHHPMNNGKVVPKWLGRSSAADSTCRSCQHPQMLLYSGCLLLPRQR